MWTYPRALKPDWSRWACCLFGLKPSWGLQDCPLPLTQSSGFRTLLGILKDSIMMWKRFPFIDIYERGKGAIVFTWNPQIYQWRLLRKKIIIQVSTPLKYCQWIVGGLVFDEGLVFLPTNFVIVILVQFCIFQKQKNPFFSPLLHLSLPPLSQLKIHFFYCSCWQKWMNLCLWQCCSLIFTVSSHAGELQKWRI